MRSNRLQEKSVERKLTKFSRWYRISGIIEMKRFQKLPILILALPVVIGGIFFSACFCPPAQASISPHHAFQMKHDCCHSGSASGCASRMLQAGDCALHTEVSTTSAAAKHDHERLPSNYLAMAVKHHRAFPLRAPFFSVTIPQALFPKNQVLRI